MARLWSNGKGITLGKNSDVNSLLCYLFTSITLELCMSCCHFWSFSGTSEITVVISGSCACGSEFPCSCDSFRFWKCLQRCQFALNGSVLIPVVMVNYRSHCLYKFHKRWLLSGFFHITFLVELYFTFTTFLWILKSVRLSLICSFCSEIGSQSTWSGLNALKAAPQFLAPRQTARQHEISG